MAGSMLSPPQTLFLGNGYDSAETLRRFEGKVQIFLPDLKYADDELARRYSGAGDYFEVAISAIDEMFRQTGRFEFGDDGVLRRGVVLLQRVSRP